MGASNLGAGFLFRARGCEQDLKDEYYLFHFKVGSMFCSNIKPTLQMSNATTRSANTKNNQNQLYFFLKN